MINNTFFIVARETDWSFHSVYPNRDRWGWEYVDGIEMFTWKEAETVLREYQSAMPSHTVRIRAKRIESGSN